LRLARTVELKPWSRAWLCMGIAGCIAITLSSSAYAATYHVRKDGNDTNCTGLANTAYPGSGSAVACAFAGINKAITTPSGAGNTILVHVGTYSECTANGIFNGVSMTTTIAIPTGKSGTSSAYNVIKAANDGTVSLVGSGTCGRAIYPLSSFWQFGGLGAGEGFTIGGDYLVNDNYVDGTVFINGLNNMRVYGNTFRATRW
jgi:hypothetical protein